VNVREEEGEEEGEDKGIGYRCAVRVMLKL